MKYVMFGTFLNGKDFTRIVPRGRFVRKFKPVISDETRPSSRARQGLRSRLLSRA